MYLRTILAGTLITNTVSLTDTEFISGIVDSKLYEHRGPSPQCILVVKYITIRGTGTYGESTKFFAVDKDLVLLSLDKPYREINSGWGAFKIDNVHFKLRNDFVSRNEVLELHTRGIVEIGYETSTYRELPQEVYMWDIKARRFDQVSGRLTHKQGLMTNIYADLADPKGEWFTMPKVLEDKRDIPFIEEKW